MVLKRSLSSEALIQLFVQLALLERTSIHLLESLKQVRKSSGNKVLKNMLDHMVKDLSEGVSLDQAFGRFPHIFNPVVLARLQAGIAGGNIQQTFQDIATYLKWKQDLKQRVRKSLLYPSVLFIAVLMLVGLMMTFMVPQLTSFFEDMDMELSMLTTSLIATSNFAKVFVPYLIPLLFILVIAFAIGAKLSTHIARKRDAWLYKIPLIGQIRLQLDQWNFSRLMQMTLQYNKRIQDCIGLCAMVTVNKLFKSRLLSAQAQLMEGNSLIQSTRQYDLLDDLALRLLEAGEVSGNLDSAFSEINEYYEAMVNRNLERLVTIIKPASLLFAALMLMWIILGTMLPLYGSLNNTRL